MARMTEADVERLQQDSAIIRNKLKIESAIRNARACLQLQETRGGFSDYLWQFVDGRPIQNRWRDLSEVPATTPQSDAMSRQLKKDGFNFVGSTICYAVMQAAGMVNDHILTCFRHSEVQPLAKG